SHVSPGNSREWWAVWSAGTNGGNQEPGRNERVGVEQEQQAYGGRRDTHVVGQCRHADQASVPGGANQVGERDTHSDTHHHLEKGDGTKQVNQEVELALGHAEGVSFRF